MTCTHPRPCDACRVIVHGRPHDERMAWDHGIPSYHEQESLRQVERTGWIGLGVALAGWLAYEAWRGGNRWVNAVLLWLAGF